MTDKLSTSLGAVLSEEHLRTVIKGAIIGPSSGLNRAGKAISFSFVRRDDSSTLPWQTFHPRSLVDYIRAGSDGGITIQPDKNDSHLKTPQLNDTNDPLLILLDALADKVSSISMIEREEVEPDTPLSNYGLDSLVSVELRNWIRRHSGVDLPLPKISNSGSLRGLAKHILSQQEALLKKS